MTLFEKRTRKAEMEKRADSADISVLFFFTAVLIFLAVHAQTDCAVLLCY